MTKPRPIGSLSAKMAACILVLVCVAIGIVGLVLPVIPGLLFLAVAALVVARQFPSVDARLRKHPALGKHMYRVDGFFRLGLLEQLQVAGLLCAKLLLDGLRLAGSWVSKEVRAFRARPF